MKKIISLLLTITCMQTAATPMSRDSSSSDLEYSLIDQSDDHKRTCCACNGCNEASASGKECFGCFCSCTICFAPCAATCVNLACGPCESNCYWGSNAIEMCCCCCICCPGETHNSGDKIRLLTEHLSPVKKAALSGDPGPLEFFLTRYGATGENKQSITARLIKETKDDYANYTETKKFHNIVSRQIENIDPEKINEEIDISNYQSSDQLSRGTLLHFAAHSQNSLLMERLIKKGAAIDTFTTTPTILKIHNHFDINIPMKCTPLHAAIAGGSKACIQMSMFAGADSDIACHDNKMPRWLAQAMGLCSVIDEVDQKRFVVIQNALIVFMPKELHWVIDSYLTGRGKEEGKETKSIN